MAVYFNRDLVEKNKVAEMSKMRTEKDSMGDVQVPEKAYYGAQTQRAVENFPISGWELPPAMIHAMGWVKLACGIANRDSAACPNRTLGYNLCRDEAPKAFGWRGRTLPGGLRVCFH